MPSPTSPEIDHPDFDQAVTLARLVLPVYLPMTAGSIGLGMLIPVLPLYLTGVGPVTGQRGGRTGRLGIRCGDQQPADRIAPGPAR